MAEAGPLYVAYHDEEWGVPEFDDRALYEKLMLDGFQAGLSWITILRKRENFRKAFDDFAPERSRAIRAQDRSLMKDAGIVRNRAKIEGAIGSARAWLDIMEKGPGFPSCCGLSRRQAEAEQLPERRAGARRKPISRARCRRSLIGRGFKFVGPTIVYAFMQAVGMVNDHLVTCHRHAASPSSQSDDEQGAKEARAATAWQRMLSGRGSICSTPRRSTSRSRTSRTGLARVARWNGQTKGAHIFSVAQHALLVEALARAKHRVSMRRAARGAAARRAGIRDRRHDLAVQGGDRRQLQGDRKRLLAAIHLRFGLPPKLPRRLTALIKAADRAAAYLEATRLAGFADEEARRFFGPPPKFSAALERDYLTPWPAGTAGSALPSSGSKNSCA